MAQIFISYAAEDRLRAQMLARWLESEGWSVWRDRKIPAGKAFDAVISEEIIAAHCVLVLWTYSSIGSDWVKEEATEAAQRKILLPILLDDAPIPLGFRRIQAARLIGWNGEADDPNIHDLRASIRTMLGLAAKGTTANTNADTALEGSIIGQQLTRAASTATQGANLRSVNSWLALILIVVVGFILGVVAIPTTALLTKDDTTVFVAASTVWAIAIGLALFAWHRRRTGGNARDRCHRTKSNLMYGVDPLA